MIIKNLDNHTEDKEILKSYLDNANIPDNIKNNILKELKKIEAGLKAQKEAAYNIEFALKNSENTYIIHDLRLVVDGRVAQIDHLIINRLLEIYVCETKNFSEGLSFNEHLEFTSFYHNKPYGIPSPIEQNNKHISVLKTLFDKEYIETPKRLGFKLPINYQNVILVSNSARISRPKNFSLDNVMLMKNEAFEKYYMDDKRIELSNIVKIVSNETIEKIVNKLLTFHQPITFNWAAKFNIENYLKADEEKVQFSGNILAEDNKKNKKIYHCDVCNTEIDNGVVFWCRKNKQKFNNQLLCREHQKV